MSLQYLSPKHFVSRHAFLICPGLFGVGKTSMAKGKGDKGQFVAGETEVECSKCKGWYNARELGIEGRSIREVDTMYLMCRKCYLLLRDANVELEKTIIELRSEICKLTSKEEESSEKVEERSEIEKKE